jgi:signal transduction histidine kinase
MQRRLKHMTRIEAAGNQLLQMLDDMLVIAQMDAGKLDFDPELLPITQFLEQIVEEFQVLHSTTHQILFESDFTITVQADPRLIRQIVVNLIANAIKYSPLGGEIRIVFSGNERQQFVFTVHDQGIGIPEDDQEHLFDAFQRGSNVSNLPGTGLGLAIVKQAVDRHGGSVHLESQSGHGTSISVVIPY